MEVINDPICSVAGCNNRKMSAGNGYYHTMCTKHHKHKYGMVYANSVDKRKKIFTGSCTICGWNEGSCHRHRMVMGKDGGEYANGNVFMLCPNHHQLLHLGLLNISIGENKNG